MAEHRYKNNKVIETDVKTMVDLTLDELRRYNGKNGNPAYIAYRGAIYDLSDSKWFADGEHLGTHFCGKDLTEELNQAPHGDDFFFDIKKIGKLI
jgi:predicted heme/steroid binding protein